MYVYIRSVIPGFSVDFPDQFQQHNFVTGDDFPFPPCGLLTLILLRNILFEGLALLGVLELLGTYLYAGVRQS
jgi:hypothetical protein